MSLNYSNGNAGKKTVKSSKIKTDISLITADHPPPKVLSDAPIYFWPNISDKQLPLVPPPTPKYVTNILEVTSRIPTEFPPLTSFNVPHVKEVGIKKCIEILGEFLGCTNFAFDYLQFWFLDMLTDCLWKTQDEYNLREQEQKIVLEWVLYVFKIVTDSKMGYSRKKFFTIFKEAILLAGDVIAEGAPDVPLPRNLFTLVSDVEEAEEESSNEDASESVSTISISTTTSEDLFEVQIGSETKEYVVSKDPCDCSSDFPSPSESLGDDMTTYTTSTKSSCDRPSSISAKSAIINENSHDLVPVQIEDYRKFYRPDPDIPKRFLPLPEEEVQSSSAETATCISSKPNEEDELERLGKASYVTDFNYMKRILSTETCKGKDIEGMQSVSSQATSQKRTRLSLSQTPGSIALNQHQKSDLFVKLTISQVLQKLTQFKLWEQRLKDMDDPKKGWVAIDATSERTAPTEWKSDEICLEADFDDLISEVADPEYKEDNRQLFSMGVLCAIIELVFEYFYQSFHFTLLKLSTQATPNIIVQALNTEWKIPKINKEELQKPKLPPSKIEKKPKTTKKEEESKKPPKKNKSEKSSKDKSKKDKKAQKEKKSKKPSEKKKIEKPKKPSKEEKEELERQRKQQEELEEQVKKHEENKRFMFPLKEAATDELFMDIFENWVKPVEKRAQEKTKGKKKK